MTNASSPALIDIDPAACLAGDDVIEVDAPEVVALARDLRSGAADDVEFARAAYEWVRDEVAHSFDVQDPRVTVSATEVLEHRVGLCYAKSHLLAALLRAEGVPTALCYQLLRDDEKGGHVLHGLVAVHLDGAWHRQDPRGNKEGVNAQFSLADEQLAWNVDVELGDLDFPALFASPASSVVRVLRSSDDVLALYANGLPASLG
ncbi:transglutaminase-like domain-containing protein [Nocardioides sp. Bht2]|uniref:transglutaminase-like domain-containing protein n=1 Tax=Nocardioides sp. Bht2 TaxID=3392297 RepID=UPI0039B4F236